MGCGKIVCVQEGSGPCFFCGNLVCTKEEKEILNRGSRKSAELYSQLMGLKSEKNGNSKELSLSAIGAEFQKATQFRNTLLAADADTERRTKVNDLESDYSNIENSPYLTSEERRAIVQRRLELQEIKERRKRNIVINLNVTDVTVSEGTLNAGLDRTYDPVIESILEKSEERRRAADAALNSAVDARWIPKGFVPKYDENCGSRFESNANEFADVETLCVMSEELARLEIERRGYAISIPQPCASLAACGFVKYVRWLEDIHLKGPVFVCSTVSTVSSPDVKNFVANYCCGGSVGDQIDYSPASILGRVYIEDCISFTEYEREEAVAKGLAARVVLSTVTYPLTCVKTLNQLGHEPFPLTTGKTLIVAGRNAYFLPNVFSYANQLARARGVSVLFTGIDSAVCSLIVQGITSFKTKKYIDTYYPEIGGKPENVDIEEKDLTDHQSFKRHLRLAIRESVVRVVTVTVARPLTVVMIRQIAQLIGNETKYGGVFSSVRLIGLEEGPAGLFSGLVPQICGEIIVVFGTSALLFAAERAIVMAGMYEKKGEKSVKEVEDLRKFSNFAIPFVVNSFGYPYQVVSTVMAVVGSGLAVSFLPYAPSFVDWHSAWDYLTPHGLKRGSRLFLREQAGAVSVGPDQQLYASTKHFVTA
ncbi:hypothetical protein GCK32_004021 [Trichostrongylus colubriformis]|uniref:Uncharacterized protein n=1 Tax=Trichostrongylus colubriformis TaxID=6319 RepID=A0AAN8FDJ7_TRICO